MSQLVPMHNTVTTYACGHAAVAVQLRQPAAGVFFVRAVILSADYTFGK